MHIVINHTTHYRFAIAPSRSLQRLRLTARSSTLQKVERWAVSVAGGSIAAEYEDHNGNWTTLVSLDPGASAVSLSCSGVVDTVDGHGIAGRQGGFMPLWVYGKQTALTRPGPRIGQLLARFGARAGGDGADPVVVLHDLSERIRDAVAYTPGSTSVDTTAEASLAAGRGVCQDHTHIFIGAARALGFPARYVSGYLLVDEEEGVLLGSQSGHAWAEAWVDALGWVGFDISNVISPDERYVRLAVGADYREAAPITGLTAGGGTSELEVELDVARQPVRQRVGEQ